MNLKKTKLKKFLQLQIAIILGFIVFGFAHRVLAANLTYSSDTTIALTSPAINFTILAGSSADSLVVNTGNIVVIIPVSVSFNITSASRDLAVNGIFFSNSAISQTCNNGVAKFSVASSNTQTLSLTISPNAVNQSCPVVTGGVSGGGSSGGGVPVSTATVLTTATATSTQLSQSSFRLLLSINENLRVGSVGDAVKLLQLFLITNSQGPFAKKLSQIGSTGYFGALTKKALAEYQKSVGIKPAAGYFGPKTRAYLKSLIH